MPPRAGDASRWHNGVNWVEASSGVICLGLLVAQTRGGFPLPNYLLAYCLLWCGVACGIIREACHAIVWKNATNILEPARHCPIRRRGGHGGARKRPPPT